MKQQLVNIVHMMKRLNNVGKRQGNTDGVLNNKDILLYVGCLKKMCMPSNGKSWNFNYLFHMVCRRKMVSVLVEMYMSSTVIFHVSAFNNKLYMHLLEMLHYHQ